jgi:RNA polymerase sigma factor (sigma-70 family)
MDRLDELDKVTSDPDRSVHELICRHEQVIRGLISRRSGPEVLRRTSVDDLYQETVAEAYAGAAGFQYRGDGPFVQWIGTIARRVITRSLRGPKGTRDMMRIRRNGSSGGGIPEAILMARERTPSSIVARGDKHMAVDQGMRELPDHYRRVLTLYFIEQRTLEDVAAGMNRTKGATCRLLARALRSMRLALCGHYFDERDWRPAKDMADPVAAFEAAGAQSI